MNNKLRTLLAFSAISLSLAAVPAFGGELEPLKVTVPFAFTAGKTSLPAGSYTVHESDTHLLMIRGDHGSAIMLGHPGSDPDVEKSAVSFQHTNKGYFLRSVQAAGRAPSVVPVTAGAER
ncbi:MAG TPA: hypothetical protein VHB50_17170 [Bryobacteraceae bacterium]|nr:hypothetical protein [Bryobacteraceae bacterium]